MLHRAFCIVDRVVIVLRKVFVKRRNKLRSEWKSKQEKQGEQAEVLEAGSQGKEGAIYNKVWHVLLSLELRASVLTLLGLLGSSKPIVAANGGIAGCQGSSPESRKPRVG